MLTFLSSFATLVLVVILQLIAILSVHDNPEKFYFFAGLLVLLWSQPLSANDPYRTDPRFIRMFAHISIALACISLAYIFKEWQPWLLAGLTLVLGLFEMFIRRSTIKRLNRVTTR